MPCGYYLEEAEEEAAAIVTHPELRETSAVRNGNVFAVDATSYFATWASDRRRARHPGVGLHTDAYPVPPLGASRGSLSRLVWRDALSSRGDRQELRHPHDLGKRVSFRVRAPERLRRRGGGVLERWDENAETYFVRKKDGTEVRVPARASATARSW